MFRTKPKPVFDSPQHTDEVLAANLRERAAEVAELATELKKRGWRLWIHFGYDEKKGAFEGRVDVDKQVSI